MRVFGRFLLGTLAILFTIGFMASLVRRRPALRRFAGRFLGAQPTTYAGATPWAPAPSSLPLPARRRGRRRGPYGLRRYPAFRRALATRNRRSRMAKMR